MPKIRVDRHEVCRGADIGERWNPPMCVFRQGALRGVACRRRAFTPTPGLAVRVHGAGVIATCGERAEFTDLACWALHGDRHQAAIELTAERTGRSELTGEIGPPAADLVR